MAQPQEKASHPPHSVGPYRISGRLGKGGMGEVFRAWDERLERWVAMKQLRPEIATDKVERDRFRREARLVAGLNHPAVVQVYDLVQDDGGNEWIVMELVEGEPLKDLLGDGPLDVAKVLSVGRQIAEGLAAAHARGVVHRDLKIENVMVTSSEGARDEEASAETPAADALRIKILDFGLAKDFEKSGDSSTLSASDALIGTTRAMAPEQVMGDAVDQRADLFSLGNLLFELLTGESPFRASTSIITLARVCNHHQPPVRDLRPEVPAALSKLVDRLLEKEPARRPSHADEVVAELVSLEERLEALTPTEVLPGAVRLRPPGEPPPMPTSGFAIKTLLSLSLADSDGMADHLGETRSFEVLARHDRFARDLLAEHGGLELYKADTFLLLFERPAEAVDYALAYHKGLYQLGEELGTLLEARAAIHLGEVLLLENSPADIARGAHQLEAEGRARVIVERVVKLARRRQTLLTREAFELAQDAAQRSGTEDPGRRFVAHGSYRLPGVEESVELFEVGRIGRAPLAPPPHPLGRRGWALVALAVLLAVLAVIVFS